MGLTQESKRMVSSSEEVMLARLWDSTERQTLTREKEEVKAGSLIDVPLLNPDQRQQYSNYNTMINTTTTRQTETTQEHMHNNELKRKRSGTPTDETPKMKYARGNSEIYDSIKDELSRYDQPTNNGNRNEDS